MRVWPVDGGTRSLRTSVAFDLLAGLKSIERFIFVLGSFHVRSTFSRENVSKPFFAAVVVQDDGWDVFYEWEVFFCLECSIRNPENAFIAFPIQNDSNTSMIFHDLPCSSESSPWVRRSIKIDRRLQQRFMEYQMLSRGGGTVRP